MNYIVNYIRALEIGIFFYGESRAPEPGSATSLALYVVPFAIHSNALRGRFMHPPDVHAGAVYSRM